MFWKSALQMFSGEADTFMSLSGLKETLNAILWEKLMWT